MTSLLTLVFENFIFLVFAQSCFKRTIFLCLCTNINAPAITTSFLDVILFFRDYIFAAPFYSKLPLLGGGSTFFEDWMTGTDRKRISKWDLKEGPHLVRGVHNDGGSGRPSSREQQPRWRHGDGNYKQSRESVDASDIWDGEATYGTRMSPGLDEWRQIMNRSPESGRGRSYRSGHLLVGYSSLSYNPWTVVAMMLL